MLAIRLQRGGRKGHAHYRVVVQDSRVTPTSGRVVAYLGSYDPHTKTIQLKKDQAQFYLDNGAQPSERVARLLKGEGVKLPTWVELTDGKKRDLRNPEKLRKNQPKEEPKEEATPEAEAPVEEVAEAPADPAEPTSEETPAEEKAEDKE